MAHEVIYLVIEENYLAGGEPRITPYQKLSAALEHKDSAENGSYCVGPDKVKIRESICYDNFNSDRLDL